MCISLRMVETSKHQTLEGHAIRWAELKVIGGMGRIGDTMCP